MRFIIIFYVVIFIIGCNTKKTSTHDFTEAMENSKLVNEGYNRCLRFVDAWLKYADPETGLIPENLNSPVWNGHNSAADNYPFMVLTTYLLDSNLYHGKMREMLETEQKLTARIGVLPDDYSLEKQAFLRETIDTSRIIFGTSEYMKDGILPITEYIGESAWSDRMLSMLDELGKHVQVAEDVQWNYSGNAETEINGELLQILTRCYWMTDNKAYLDWALKIGDYYLLNLDNDLSQASSLRLRDHGCEVIGGLGELYATLHFVDQEKKIQYQPQLKRLLDRILEVGINKDGVFYNVVDMAKGTPIDTALVDNWGYLYDTFYAVYQLDSISKYREVMIKALSQMQSQYLYYDWENGSADGYADAIESGINLYNREPIPSLATWIDASTQLMWSIQDSAFRENAQEWKGSGIIEGWHGDGNFARTTIMYCLWKTQGTYLRPWREDVYIGASSTDNDIVLSLLAENETWQGKLALDIPRHKINLNLPMDYPRINQFPEWFTVDDTTFYEVVEVIQGIENPIGKFLGKELKSGISMQLETGKRKELVIRKINAGNT